MTDGFWSGQVDGCDPMRREADCVEAVLAAGADCERFAAEGLRDFPEFSPEADIILGKGDSAHDLTAVIDDGGQLCRHGPRAGAIAIGGNLQTERFMWPLEVIYLPPSIEGPLHLPEVVEP